MFGNYLKITFRSLIKNRLFVLINVFGLGIALACCIVAYLNWEYNAKFDAHHEHANELYRINFVRTTNGRLVQNGSCPMPLGAIVEQSIPQVEQVVRYIPTNGNFKVGTDIFRSSIAAVDPGFFDAFTFQMRYGDPSKLSDKSSIFISTELQERHFPNLRNPVGETITYIDGDKRTDYRVAGLFEKQPQNSSFSSEAYINYENVLAANDWDGTEWQFFNSTFVRIADRNAVASVEEQLQEYVEIQNRSKEDYKVDRYYLDPFAGMAVRAEKEDTWNHWFQQSLPVAAASAPGIMALLILLIACFNFTNTSVAIANRRIKEIGVRKVLGSSKRQLVAQFLGENLVLTCLALLAGIGIAAILVPAYSAMWAFLDIRLNLFDNLQLIGFLGILLLFTGIVAGSYPAFYVSSFQPTAIFRGNVKFSGTNTLTRILLTLQFAISLIAVICGFIFAQNANYQNAYDLGFNYENVVYAYVKDESGYNTMRNALQGQEAVIEMAGSRHNVTNSWYTDPIKFESSEMDVDILDIGAGYLSTIGAELVAGRDFRENSQIDADRSVIVNEEVVRTFGWDDPIDQRITLRDTIQLYVVGVVKDIYIDGALWEPLQPMLMRHSDQSQFRYLSVRTDVASVSQVKTLMDDTWKRIFPDELSTVDVLAEERAQSAEVNLNIKTLFLFLGAVAVFLSIIGLFSLVSLNLIKRMKEIGVRKILGASIGNITVRMSKEFIIILVIASALGSVAGYFLANMLMGSIWTYYVPISPFVFVISIAILFLIGGITIGGKIVKAATVNPASILHDD